MVAAALIGSAVVGGVVATSSANKASQVANNATQAATSAANNDLDFQKEVYRDQKPYIDKANDIATQSADLNLQTSRDTAAHAKTAWEQNQQVTQGAIGQMGLNAMGANYLNPDQTNELIGLNKVMASGTPAEQARAQQRINDLQSTAKTNAMDLEKVNAQRLADTGQQQGAAMGQLYAGAGAGIAGLGDAYATSMTQQGDALAGDLSSVGRASGKTAITNAKNIGGQLEVLGNTAADGTLADGEEINSMYGATGASRMAEQTGYYNSEAADLQRVAAQRAKDFEAKATTRTNADIANSADQAQRQLLRVGGDPNRMAALSADIAQGQQLARIHSGNEVEGVNIANLNAADDQARGLRTTGFNLGSNFKYGAENAGLAAKSASLEKARELRTAGAAGNISTQAQGLEAARQTEFGADTAGINLRANANAQGLSGKLSTGITGAQTAVAGQAQGQLISNAGENASVATLNNAKDKIDNKFDLGLQGLANYGAGFGNTSAQAVSGSIAAGSAGVNNLNTSINAGNGAASLVNGATGQAVNAGNVGVNAANQILQGGALKANAVAGVGGTIAGLMLSTKELKKNREPVDPDSIVEGLEHASPEVYDYKDGVGTPGRKIGAMAEDLQEQFGDAVAPGGKQVDVQNMIGLQHAAIVGLSKRIKRLESRGSH